MSADNNIQGIGMASEPLITTESWADIQITKQDVEFLHNYLFEHESPLTTRELVNVLIHERNRMERAAAQREQQARGKAFLPKDSHEAGEDPYYSAEAAAAASGASPFAT